MIIVRTPFRISFFGGGTDYPVWFRQNGGAVLSTTIDKYCYITCRKLPPFFEHKHRIVYSKLEYVKSLQEIQHPAVKAILQYKKIEDGLEIHYDADLPARSGLGSSSAFTVALLHALYSLEGKMVSKHQLAGEAIYIEQEIIKEHVGSQDQIAAAYGGFNKISFNKDGAFDVDPVMISREKLSLLQDHLLFFFTGITRFASDVAARQIEETPNKQNQLHELSKLVEEGISVLANDKEDEMSDLGKLLHEGWMIKKSLTDKISNPAIDDLYNTALANGAIGGKLIGAGGGGFMLFFAEPRYHDKLKQVFSHLLHVPIKFENSGSQVIFYNSHY